jgi:glycerate 2-kinase
VNPDLFLTHSLRDHPRGDAIARILAAAISAVEPGAVVRNVLSIEDHGLIFSGQRLDVTGRVFILGIGKAAAAMTGAAADILGSILSGGLVVTKHTPELPHPKLEILLGGHPVPDEKSLAAGKQVEEFVRQLDKDDLLICLISGGGSSLVSLPENGISLQDLRTLTLLLLESGARIDEINLVRRQLDRLKGGGLAQMAIPARVVSLILSDVVGSPLEVIASGPTCADPTTAKDAMAVIRKYGLEDKCPVAILDFLKLSVHQQRKTSDFGHVQNYLVGNNLIAAQAALREAADAGFHPYLLRTDLQGEAREAARDLAIQLRWAWKMGDPAPRPACIVAGGETTVTVQGDGRGGRNTELALAAVSELADFPDVMLVTMATDGEDGPTDAAGAVVTGGTWRRGLTLGMNSTEFLNRNDSYPYFFGLDDLLKPGPTGTNVNDLTFLFTF